MVVDQTSWETATRHLYRDAVAFVATGPRRHEDWVLDVLALMARVVQDPRGWARVDDSEMDSERVDSPVYPFAVHPPGYISSRLMEIDRSSAESLLLALTEAGCTLDNLQYFDESEEELRAMARTVLDRYGNEATYHTNVRRAGSAPGTLDFAQKGFEYAPLSVLMEDCGLVVVSPEEVGLFWSFSD
ncbi:hypothetical protein AB0G74_12825 [Streptomyces sp. NPDC020875]|uniref:hypothetical protein n=1 Tax=Streptomyces sp. NPDC020875 TaxID=3154898 RepID=UPI0033C8FBA5